MTFNAGFYYIGSLFGLLRFELASLIKTGFGEIKISDLYRLYPDSDFSDLGEFCADFSQEISIQYANFFIGPKDSTLSDSTGFKYSIEGEHIGIINLSALTQNALDTKLLTYRHNRVCSKFSEFNYGHSAQFNENFKVLEKHYKIIIADIVIFKNHNLG